MSLTQSYRPLLASPATRSVLLVGSLARIPIFASWVVITLHVVSTLDRGYGAAGFAAAVAAGGVALGSPLRGRLIDRLGLRRALVPSLVVTGVVWAIAPWVGYWAFVALAAIGGFFLLPIFAVIRMALVAAVDESQRRAALSLDSVLTEVSFMIGPLLGAWAATTWDTRWVLVGVQACVVVGGIMVWVADPPLRAESSDGEHAPRREWMSRPLLAVYVCAGATVTVLMGTDLGIIAELREADLASLIGPVLAIWGFGSLVGGLGYGAMSGRIPIWLLLGGLAAVTAPIALAPDRWTFMGLVFVAGVMCAPTMTALVEEISRLVPPAAMGEAMGWHVSAITLGEALGTPLAGVAIDRWGPGAGFWSVALIGAVAAGLILLATARSSGQTRAFSSRRA